MSTAPYPSIQALRIQHFRNLSEVELLNLAPVNLFWGDNGSGKTSLLEAIYFAGTGRSFRSNQVQHVIQNSADRLCIGATVSTKSACMKLSVQRSASGSKAIEWDGKKLNGFAPIAQALPLQYVSTLSYRFFTDGPKIRRQFFDWSMFHVKPVFYTVWKEWQRLLAQRNSSLKQRRPVSEVSAWDEPLCELASVIDEQRQELIFDLKPILKQHLQLLGAPFECSLRYERGWEPTLPLSTALKQQVERDYQLGYTSLGPQRADFQLLVGGEPAVHVLSQGQQKLAMYAMHLTQGFYLQQETSRKPIYLIDDMASELDPQIQKTVLTHLVKGLNAQLFLTGITEELFSNSLTNQSRIFHINNGKTRGA